MGSSLSIVLAGAAPGGAQLRAHSGARRASVPNALCRPRRPMPKAVDYRKLRKLIKCHKLAPCHNGLDMDCGSRDLEVDECPICFLAYPSLNQTVCCNKLVCTECFVRVQCSSKPPGKACCPYCKANPLSVKYMGARSQEERERERREEQDANEALMRWQKQQAQQQTQEQRRPRAEQQQQQQHCQTEQQQGQQRWRLRQQPQEAEEGVVVEVVAVAPAHAAPQPPAAHAAAAFEIAAHAAGPSSAVAAPAAGLEGAGSGVCDPGAFLRDADCTSHDLWTMRDQAAHLAARFIPEPLLELEVATLDDLDDIMEFQLDGLGRDRRATERTPCAL